MGNVPAKESQQGRRRGSSFAGAGALMGASSTVRSTALQRMSKNSSSSAVAKKSSRSDREKFKELHAQGLVVKFDENVDGGYLAPYGTYNLNLDYKISTVKELIIERKLAPFYTPLQDYEADWTDEQLLDAVAQLKLHALPHEADDEDEELVYDVDAVNEASLSKKELKRHFSKKFNKELRLRRLKWQEQEEERYRRDRGTSRQYASSDLKLELYRDSVECPICFLYYPRWMNYSRCCNHPICSECFVQIKRLDPHFPHDHDDDEGVEKEKIDPNLLISEPASCPYCATPNFGVIFQSPQLIRTGMGGIPPSLFHSSKNCTESAIMEDEEVMSFEVQENYFRKASIASNLTNISQRRGSLPSTHPRVITTDFIRPDWEHNLNAARSKLAKRSAAASAIHASNMLIQTNHEEDLEQRMIEEAMRLSLLDEETRRRRASSVSRSRS